MTRQEYTDRVLSVLRRVTAVEREAIRAELDAHMEDHICDLLELGYAPELAEERTMAQMGDPEEVGRELNKQYPLRWLVVSRAAAVLLAVLCLLAVSHARDMLDLARRNLTARTTPWELDSTWDDETCRLLDIRVPVGTDILYIYGVDTEAGLPILYWVRYDQSPFGVQGADDDASITFWDPRGEELINGGGGGRMWGVSYNHEELDVQPEDTYVTVRVDRLGERQEVRIPLGEEAVQ